mmetsp:Transcript_22306/g.60230  ORF Transcript_22306/g.60230 Transcript_22306/m.60230 type:complete len:208 (-) Transcript_22306:149-772(-)
MPHGGGGSSALCQGALRCKDDPCRATGGVDRLDHAAASHLQRIRCLAPAVRVPARVVVAVYEARQCWRRWRREGRRGGWREGPPVHVLTLCVQCWMVHKHGCVRVRVVLQVGLGPRVGAVYGDGVDAKVAHILIGDALLDGLLVAELLAKDGGRLEAILRVVAAHGAPRPILEHEHGTRRVGCHRHVSILRGRALHGGSTRRRGRIH